MNTSKKLYIAGIGAITSVGGDFESTYTAVEAGISAYELSEFESVNGDALKIAKVPDIIFGEIESEAEVKIPQGNRYCTRHDRISIMSVIALLEACSGITTQMEVPLILANSEYPYEQENLASLFEALSENQPEWFNAQLTRSIHSGRPAGIEGVELIFQYLYEADFDYFLIGAADSYINDEMLSLFDEQDRILYENNANAFVPGEGAAYLLLTNKPELALSKNGYRVALNVPSTCLESGAMFSDEPYHGDGLATSVKNVTNHLSEHCINRIYCSLNGEHYWAKELGVLQLRNANVLAEQLDIVHPAENYGDSGSATSALLMALSAQKLWSCQKSYKHLVYSSADGDKRSAIVMEKVPV